MSLREASQSVSGGFRLFLLPLKLPKSASYFRSTASANSIHASATTAPATKAASILPYPFLYVHLSRPLLQDHDPALGMSRRSRLSRFLSWSEAKWQTYSEASPRSIKGLVYRLGSTLLERVPPGEKQLWRLHALRDHLDWLAQSKEPCNRLGDALVLETSRQFCEQQHKLSLDLLAHLVRSAAHHRRWSFVSIACLLPAAVLSLLPFGKLLLAWVVFRAVAHWRAFQGASFLVDCLGPLKRGRGVDGGNGLLSNAQPDIRFIVNEAIDSQLPIAESKQVQSVAEGLARELHAPELVNVLPRAYAFLVNAEQKSDAHRSSSRSQRRRKFSNENLLDP